MTLESTTTLEATGGNMLMEWCNDCRRYHGRGYCEASGSLQSVCSPAPDQPCGMCGAEGVVRTPVGASTLNYQKWQCPQCKGTGRQPAQGNAKLSDASDAFAPASG